MAPPVFATLAVGSEVRVGSALRRVTRLAGHAARPLLRLDGCERREDAEALTGSDLFVAREHLGELEEDEWWAEDLQSSNGTFISTAGAPLPDSPIPPGQRIEFAPGDRVYVGAWTRLVIRKATSDEQ